MGSARGLANHSLYMARLLIDAWSVQERTPSAMPEALNAAFAPAVRLHLLDAYGWSLLAVLRAQPLPGKPPHHTQSLPSVGAGLAVPAEVDFCRELEQGGWLNHLQTDLPAGMPPRRRAGMLASSQGYPDRADCQHWFEQLSSLIDQHGANMDEN